MKNREIAGKFEHTREAQIPNGETIDIRTFTKKLAHDTAIYVPAKIFPGLMGVVSVVLFTRLFTPEEYGKYILVVTTTTILTAILSQWVSQSTLRYRPQYMSTAQVVAFNKNLFTILFLLSISFIIISMGLFAFRNYLADYEKFYILSILIIITGIWSNNLLTVLQSDLNSMKFTLCTVIRALLKVSIPLILILLIRKDIVFLLYGLIVSSSVIIIPMLISIGHQKEYSNEKVDVTLINKNQFLPFLKQFYLYGFPMIGWFLGAQLLSMSDRYLLEIFRGSTEVGIYSSNYNLVASAISFVTMPLLTAAHPLLMKAGGVISNKKEQIEHLISIFSRYFLLIAIPIIIYVSFLYRELTEIMLDQDFRTGGIVIPIVLFGFLAWNFAMFGHKGLELRNKTKIMFIFVVICAVLNIILNIIFIPYYGYKAAAVTTLVAFLAYPVLVYIGTRKDIKWHIPWTSALKSFVAAMVPLGLFFVIKGWHTSTIAKVTIDAIIMIFLYIPLLYLLKEVTPQEYRYIKTFFRTLIFQKITRK